MNLKEFVERVYLPYIEELRASTKKRVPEIWNNHICDRVGHIRLREFRTVDASKMLRAIADDHDLSKTTLQHIKSVLSAVFTHAKNEDAFDGVNPVQDARIPRNARESCATFAYNLTQIRRILDVLPLFPKPWSPRPPLRGSAKENFLGSNGRTIQAIRSALTGRSGEMLLTDQKRERVPRRCWSFGGEPMDLDKLGQNIIRPAAEAISLEWYGWHGFRRGIASNLYELGATEKVVQRVLRHSKPHVTKERYQGLRSNCLGCDKES